MNQKPLFIEPRTKYKVKYKSRIVNAWFIGGIFNFDNYSIAREGDVEVLERIGNESEVFG